ncbi:MAG TPA: class I SAM-dependent methyltransferase [Lacipirellula sp.]
MVDLGYQALIEHYESCLAKHGDSHLGVDWPTAEGADVRYRVMLDVIAPGAGRTKPQAAVTLLDFGCGAAHLAEYIERRDIRGIEYIGLDASPQFVELSRRKFPSRQFHCIDVLAENAELPEADYIVMNGVLTEKRGLAFDQMQRYMERLLPRVFAAVRVGMAFNVMSKHVDWERDDLFHVPYDMLAAFLKANVSRHFQFRADYGLYEYTTYVYREPR